MLQHSFTSIEQGVVNLPRLGSVFVVPFKPIGRFSHQLTELDLPEYLGIEALPEKAPLIVKDLEEIKDFVDEEGNPFIPNWSAVTDLSKIDDRTFRQFLSETLTGKVSQADWSNFVRSQGRSLTLTSLEKFLRDHSSAGIDALESFLFKKRKLVITELINERFGSFRQSAICQVDESGKVKKVLYDFVSILDGQRTILVPDPESPAGYKPVPLSEANSQNQKGIHWGTSGVLAVNVVRLEGVLYAVLNLQQRPLMIDLDVGTVTGQWVLGTAGGFGSAALTPEQQAELESRTEQGTLKYRKYAKLGKNFDNRAKSKVPQINTVLEVEVMDLAQPEPDDVEESLSIHKISILLPMCQWIPGQDALVNNAMSVALKAYQVIPFYG